jgi:phosphoglycerate mutase family protein
MLDRYVPALMAAYERANGKDLLVVTHGAAIRVLCIHALADPNITRSHIDNGSLTVIEPVGEFGQWRCPTWASND